MHINKTSSYIHFNQKVMIHPKFQVICTFILFNVFFLSSCTDENDGTAPVQDWPTLHTENLTVTEGDQDQVVEVNVTLTGVNTTNAIVQLSSVPGVAESPDDYTLLTTGQLIFGKDVTTLPISIRIKADEGQEPVESFEIKLYNPQNCFIENDVITVTIQDDDDNSSGLVIPSGGYTSPESYDGYTLVWRDEFDADTLNTTNWSYEIGNGCPNLCGWGNNELEYYREDNTSLVSGHLVITAKKQNFDGYEYTSSRLFTKGKQQFKFGRIDIRAALPEGQGIWPALWMLGSNNDAVGWPACGEIDIMELTGDVPNRVVGTVHYGANLSQHGYKSASRFTTGDDSFQEKFHVYSINWENNLIEFFIV